MILTQLITPVLLVTRRGVQNVNLIINLCVRSRCTRTYYIIKYNNCIRVANISFVVGSLITL